MIVAQEKRKSNIVEYIIYMWQIEDLIRALSLDMSKIETVLVSKYDVDDSKKNEIRLWFQNLTLMMQKEQRQKDGHLQFLVNLVNDLNQFHETLIVRNIDQEYSNLYNDILPDIHLVRQKSGRDHHDIEVSLNTLYLILMLKMKNQEISEGTQAAIWKFGNFMGHLSKLFKLYEAGDLDLDKEQLSDDDGDTL
jgi:hypothetical protein